MGCSFQHGCLNACRYDKSCCLQDVILQILLIPSCEDHPSPPLQGLSHTISYVPVPSFISLCYQSWSNSEPTETPFTVAPPTCTSQPSELCTSTETELLHPHHTHRLGDSLNSATDTGWFALIPNLASWNPFCPGKLVSLFMIKGNGGQGTHHIALWCVSTASSFTFENQSEQKSLHCQYCTQPSLSAAATSIFSATEN